MHAVGRVAALALTLLLAVAGAGPAAAHTELAATTPRDGQTLASAPAVVELVFTGVLQQEFVQVVVSGGANGARLDLEAPGVTRTTVRQPLPPALAAGRYVVGYRVVAADGHPITGQISFTYAPAENDPEVTVAATATAAIPPTGGTGAADASDGWAAWGWLAGAALLAGAVLVMGRSRRAR